MSRYIEAPDYSIPCPRKNSVFLAGGISNCPDWQKELTQKIRERKIDVDIFNPRRYNFDLAREEETVEQIKWEHYYLKRCYNIVFWFPQETLCPITLFEYGKYLTSQSNLIVGCHPGYLRKLDLEVQTSLERPHLKIYSSLDQIIEAMSYKYEIDNALKVLEKILPNFPKTRKSIYEL